MKIGKKIEISIYRSIDVVGFAYTSISKLNPTLSQETQTRTLWIH